MSPLVFRTMLRFHLLSAACRVRDPRGREPIEVVTLDYLDAVTTSRSRPTLRAEPVAVRGPVYRLRLLPPAW